MTIDSNTFLVFEVGLHRLTYITLIESSEFDDLTEMFDSYDLRAQTKYKGPLDWMDDVFNNILEELDGLESDIYHGFPLYRIEHLHDIWSIVRATAAEIESVSTQLVL
jgi:hypothetical protein